jgi:uncharacterized membrane protein YgdD (TMEM256/DUF423 family)
MKPEGKNQKEHTFVSPFSLETASTRLKSVTKRGVTLNVGKLDNDHVAFQLSAPHGIGIVTGHLSRDGNQTSVTYTMRWSLRGALSFAVVHAYPMFVFMAGVPLGLAFGIYQLVNNHTFEAVVCFGGVTLMIGWLLSAWRAAFKQQDVIAQILYYTLRDPIPDIPDLSRS